MRHLLVLKMSFANRAGVNGRRVSTAKIAGTLLVLSCENTKHVAAYFVKVPTQKPTPIHSPLAPAAERKTEDAELIGFCMGFLTKYVATCVAYTTATAAVLECQPAADENALDAAVPSRASVIRMQKAVKAVAVDSKKNKSWIPAFLLNPAYLRKKAGIQDLFFLLFLGRSVAAIAPSEVGSITILGI